MFITFRLARRCHLTEQIGARRRDLYANDMFTPLDDNIVWEYKRPTPMTDNYGAEDSQRRARNTVERRPASEAPIRSISATSSIPEKPTQQDGAHLVLQRRMEVLISRLLSTRETMDLELFQCVMGQVTQLISDMESHTHLGFSPGSFLEDYLCLYHRCEMGSVLNRLTSSASPLPSSIITSLGNYYECLAVPTADELTELRECLSRVDFTKSPKSLLADLARMHLFLHHPLIEGFIRSSPKSSEPASSVKVKFPTKNEIKKLKELVPHKFKLLIPDALKDKQLSVMLAYRASLAVSSNMDDNPSVEFLKKVSEEFKPQTGFLTSINTHLKSSLFSP